MKISIQKHFILSMFVSSALFGASAMSGCASESGGESGGGSGDGSGGGNGSGSGKCTSLATPATPGVIATIHVGYDGGADTFVGPILGNFTADAVAIADGSIATVEAFGDCNLVAIKSNPITELVPHVIALVHPQKPGQSMVTATIGGKTFATNVVVENYTAAAVALGRKRYTQPDNPSATRRACAECHQQPGGADHSPPALAFWSDAIIRSSATMGTLPACFDATGSECTCGPASCFPIPADKRMLNVPGGHKWEFTAAELDAIVPYLRSLPLRQK